MGPLTTTTRGLARDPRTHTSLSPTVKFDFEGFGAASSRKHRDHARAKTEDAGPHPVPAIDDTLQKIAPETPASSGPTRSATRFGRAPGRVPCHRRAGIAARAASSATAPVARRSRLRSARSLVERVVCADVPRDGYVTVAHVYSESQVLISASASPSGRPSPSRREPTESCAWRADTAATRHRDRLRHRDRNDNGQESERRLCARRDPGRVATSTGAPPRALTLRSHTPLTASGQVPTKCLT